MFDFTKRGPLMMPVGGSGGSGAGSGEGSGTPAFDIEAFTTKLTATLMGEVDKRFNAMDKKFKALTKEQKTEPTGEGAGTATGSGEGAGTGTAEGQGTGKITDPAVNAQIQLLQKQIKTLSDENKKFAQERDTEKAQRLETERVTSIRNVLNGIEFRDQESRDLVFSAVKDAIKRNDEGQLVAETDSGAITYDAHIKSVAERYPYLLQPKTTGGAGATGGTKLSGGKSFDQMSVSEIASLKPEDKAALYSGLREQFGSSLSNG